MKASDHRQAAREALSGHWGEAVLVALIAAILGGAVACASFNINISNELKASLPEVVVSILAVWASVSSVLGLVQFIIGGTIRLGHCQYVLKLQDRQNAELRDLFSQFGRFLQGFLLNLLTSLFIALWALLFIIPGIVAAFRYAMAPFILYENPDMSAMDAIRASKEMMKGHKWELFCLILSFFGWILLACLTFGIGLLFVNPYISQAYASFYRYVKGGTGSTGYTGSGNTYYNDI